MNRIKILILSLSLFSCALFIPGYSDYNKAKKYYNNRSYDLAVEYAYSSLLRKVDNKKAIKLFELSFTNAVSNHISALSSLFKIEADSKWPDIVKEYKSLIKLNGIIKELKPLLEKELSYQIDFEYKDYSSQLAEANSLAASYHYLLGIDFQEDIDKASQKKAAINFRLSQDYIPNYLDSKELYEQARANAVFSLLFREFEGAEKYSAFIREKVIEHQSVESKEFLRIITRDELETILSEQALIQSGIAENNYNEMTKLSGADHILGATVLTSYKPPEKIINKNIAQEKEVVIRTETYVDSLGDEQEKKIKGTVKAVVNHFKKNSEASMNLTYQIVNVNDNETLFTGSVAQNKSYRYEWATFKGDKRALSSKYSLLVNRKEQFAPSEDELFLAVVKNISKKLEKKISSHYGD